MEFGDILSERLKSFLVLCLNGGNALKSSVLLYFRNPCINIEFDCGAS